MKSDSLYHQIMPHDSCESLTLLEHGKDDALEETRWHSTLHRISLVLVVQMILNLVVAGVVIGNHLLTGGPTNTIFPQPLYSPVQHLISYETQVFHEGFGKDQSLYQQPPSPEVDAAWEDLYNFGVSRITKEEASRLWNSTYRLPGDEDHYVIQLDVFHQLHCLNMLRKAIHPEYYKNMDRLDPQHWGHCIESIRQSLMCSADVSPLVWQWVDRVQEVRIMGNIAHTCRNYDKIKEWGLSRRLDHELNYTGFK